MHRVDLEQFQERCVDRGSTEINGDYVELGADVGAYRILVGFDRESRVVKAASVEIRPARSIVTAPQAPDDGSDHEPEMSQWEAAGRFLKAITSKAIQGPVVGAKLDFRVMCCFGENMAGEVVGEPCQSMVTKNENNYCRSCGCGTKRKMARLNPQKPQDWNTSKLAYPYLNCPLSRFGPVNGSRADG